MARRTHDPLALVLGAGFVLLVLFPQHALWIIGATLVLCWLAYDVTS